MPRLVDPSPDAPSAPPPWLVGRGREWERLSACLATASRGAGGLAIVSGEAGLGKTALVEALADEARQRGLLVLAGGCYDLTITPSYGPWREALTGYRSGDWLPELPATL